MRKKHPRQRPRTVPTPHKKVSWTALELTLLQKVCRAFASLPGPLLTFQKATNMQLIFLRKGETIFIENAFLCWLMDKKQVAPNQFYTRSVGWLLPRTRVRNFPAALLRNIRGTCARQKILPISSDVKCRLEIWGVSFSSLLLAFNNVKVESPKVEVIQFAH